MAASSPALVAVEGNCSACWHLWQLHGADGCTASTYPGHSLNGVPCRCKHTTPTAPDPAEAEQWLRCPRCGAEHFTYDLKPYGIELACFRCPTYIGAKLRQSQPQDSSRVKRLFATLFSGLELGDER